MAAIRGLGQWSSSHNPLSNDKFKRERGQETEPSSFCSARGLMTCAVLALLFGSEWKHSAPARFRLLSGVTASLLAYPTAFTLWILLIRILLEQFGWLLLIWSVVDAAGSVGRLVYSELSSRDQRRKTFKELVMYGGLLVFIVMNWGDGRRIYQ
jgi:hypothetical protein